MARLIYASLALAAASLVAGFVVRTTNLPLFISIALSAMISTLILAGWSKRLRETGALSEPGTGTDVEELPVDEVEAVLAEPVATPAQRRSRIASLRERSRSAKPRPQPAVEMPEPLPRLAGRGEKPARATRPERAKAGPKSTTRIQRSGSVRKPPARVMVIPGRSRFHAKGCRFAKGDQVRQVAEATARKRGYEPCSICLPDAR